MWNHWSADGNATLQMNTPPPPPTANALVGQGQAVNAPSTYSPSAGIVTPFIPTNPTSILPIPAANPYTQYTAAQFASMTAEQQYAVQQHWQQWEVYHQEYARWYAQYGEQYNRDVEAANVANNGYSNFFQQQPPPSLLQVSSSPLQQSTKATAQSQLYSQPPPAFVDPSTTKSVTDYPLMSNPPLHMPPPNQTTSKFAKLPPNFNALQPPPPLSHIKETFVPVKYNFKTESAEQNQINDNLNKANSVPAAPTTETNKNNREPEINTSNSDSKYQYGWQNAALNNEKCKLSSASNLTTFNTLNTGSNSSWGYINQYNNNRIVMQKSVEIDEDDFDRQFQQWEKQFEKWRCTHAGHADEKMYKRYEQEFEKQRQRIIARRDLMRRRKKQQLDQSTQLLQTADNSQQNMQSIQAKDQRERNFVPTHQGTCNMNDSKSVNKRNGGDISTGSGVKEHVDKLTQPNTINIKEDQQTSIGKHENKCSSPIINAKVSLTNANDSVINLDDDVHEYNDKLVKCAQPISELFKRSNGIPGLDLLKNGAFDVSNRNVDEHERKTFDDAVLNTSSDTLSSSNITSKTSILKPSTNSVIPAIANSLNDPEFMKRISEAVAKAQGRHSSYNLEQTNVKTPTDNYGSQFSFFERQKLRNAGQRIETVNAEYNTNLTNNYYPKDSNFATFEPNNGRNHRGFELNTSNSTDANFKINFDNCGLSNSNFFQLNDSEIRNVPPNCYRPNRSNDYSSNESNNNRGNNTAVHCKPYTSYGYNIGDKNAADFANNSDDHVGGKGLTCNDLTKNLASNFPGSRRNFLTDKYHIDESSKNIPNGNHNRNASNHRFHNMSAFDKKANRFGFNHKTNTWLRGSHCDFDEDYRPKKVFDYANSPIATTKVIDYGHQSVNEFKPVKTIDYGHSSKPKHQQQNEKPRKNNKNSNNKRHLARKHNNNNYRNNKNNNYYNRNNYKYENKLIENENNCEKRYKKADDDVMDDKYSAHSNLSNDSERKTDNKISVDVKPEDLEEISDTDDLCDIIDIDKKESEKESPAPPPPPMLSLSDSNCNPDSCNVSKDAVPVIIPLASTANDIETKASADYIKTSISSIDNQNSMCIDEILLQPGRLTRPKRICMILRGPPGSGKSHVSKLIKEKENQMGGANPRILSIDDYFLIENDYDEKCPKTGKKIPKKEILYEYDKDMEETYMQYLVKSFKKTVSDNLYDFIIIDCNNNSLRTLNEFYCYSKDSGFTPYIIDMICDLEVCYNRNIHQRSKEDIQGIISTWNPTPLHYVKLDVSTLLENVVEMEDAENVAVDDQPLTVGSISSVENLTATEPSEADDKNEDDDSNDAKAYCGFLKSKWEMDNTSENLERLDGTSRLSNKRKPTMEEYLQMDDWQPSVSITGKKRVRWADIEEKRQQDKMRAVGFVVGQTDWKRMMDPNGANKALNKTKYIERINKRY